MAKKIICIILLCLMFSVCVFAEPESIPFQFNKFQYFFTKSMVDVVPKGLTTVEGSTAPTVSTGFSPTANRNYLWYTSFAELTNNHSFMHGYTYEVIYHYTIGGTMQPLTNSGFLFYQNDKQYSLEELIPNYTTVIENATTTSAIHYLFYVSDNVPAGLNSFSATAVQPADSNGDFYLRNTQLTITKDDGTYFQDRSLELLESLNGKLDGVKTSIDDLGNKLSNKLDDVGNKVDSVGNKVDEAGNKISNKMQDLQDNEINKTNENGDTAESEEALNNALSIDDFKESMTSLFSFLSYSGTDSILTFPASGDVPYVGYLWDSHEINLTEWFSNLPPVVLICVRFLFVSGCVFLIVHDLQSLIKFFSVGDDGD